MRKPKIFAATLIGAFLLMGAGYAAWNETALISNTVGTGELKVEFSEVCVWPNVSTFDNAIDLPDADSLTATIETTDPHTTTVTMNGLYPGSTVNYEARLDNKGSIPAVLQDAVVTFGDNMSPLIKENLKVHGQIKQFRPTPSGGAQLIKTYSLPAGMGGPGGTHQTPATLATLQAALNTLISSSPMELLPEDYITFDVDPEYQALLAEDPDLGGGYNADTANCLFFTLPEFVGNDLEKQSGQFNITFNFKQFNQ